MIADRPSGEPPTLTGAHRDPVIDSVRGAGVLLMVWVHAAPSSASGVLGGLAGAILSLAFGFFVLAGMTTRWVLERKPRARRVLVLRGLLLIALGAVLQDVAARAPSFEIPVILHTLGVLLIAAAIVGPLTDRTTFRVLLAAGAVATAGCFLWAIPFGCGCVCDQPPAASDLLDGLAGLRVFAGGLLATGFYPVVVWVVPFLIGALLAPRGLRHERERLWLFALGAALVLLGTGIAWAASAAGWPVSIGDARVVPWEYSRFNPSLVTLLIMSGAVLMIPLAYWRLYRILPLERLVAVGQAALPVYVGHLLVLAVWPDLLYEWAWTGWASALAIVAAAAWLGAVWGERRPLQGWRTGGRAG